MANLKKINFTVLTNPIPLARPRFSHGRAYLPQRSRDYRQIVRQAAKSAMVKFAPMMTTDELFSGELFCRLDFYRKFKTVCRNFGDLDNHVKAVLDALNGIVFADDAQIVRCEASKHTDKLNPRVTIEIGEL